MTFAGERFLESLVSVPRAPPEVRRARGVRRSEWRAFRHHCDCHPERQPPGWHVLAFAAMHPGPASNLKASRKREARARRWRRAGRPR